jgi:hypothetical protein
MNLGPHELERATASELLALVRKLQRSRRGQVKELSISFCQQLTAMAGIPFHGIIGHGVESGSMTLEIESAGIDFFAWHVR